MAEWCREAGLNDEREKHLEELLLLDAEHKGARAALGYTKVDGRWVLPEEHMRSLGYVRFEGGWRLPQEKKGTTMAGTMNRIGSLAKLLAASLLALAAAPAVAQSPKLEGPLKIVVGYPPGGATDRAARLVADALKDEVGVPIVVENKTGAGGRLAAQQVKAAGPDQNILMIGNPAINVVAPIVFKDAGYDQYRDFVPVAQVTRYEFALVAGPNLPVKNVRELIGWLKANPAQANFGVPATGSLPHFFALMLAAEAGVLPQVVGYRGSAPLANDVMGGQIPVSIDTLDIVLPFHQAGKLRILAVTGSKRESTAPDVPTVAETAVPGYEFTIWFALYAPAGTPKPIIDRLNSEVVKALAQPQMREKLARAGVNAGSSSPEELGKYLRAEVAKWAKTIKAAKIPIH